MIRNLLYLVFGAALLAGCVVVHKTEHAVKAESDTKHQPKSTQKSAHVLRHVVLFRFKEGTADEQIKKIENAFSALPSKIDAIHDFEWGNDVSVENRSEGFTHCFLVTFLSEADRGVYISHHAHKEFGSMLGPYLDKVLVVDYWAKP